MSTDKQDDRPPPLPKITMSGGRWVAYYGKAMLDSVHGFGDTPHEARMAYEAAWNRSSNT